MRIVLIDPRDPLWRKFFGFLAMIVVVPIALIVKLIILPFERPAKVTADEVVAYLRDFLDGTGGDWDWDDFTSVPIADPDLEKIRLRAAEVDPSDTDELKELLNEAEAIAASQRV